MSAAAIITASAQGPLAERMAELARLIETHPAYHLLAEYEALFLDRHPCAAETIPCLEQAADDLLARVNDVIEHSNPDARRYGARGADKEYGKARLPAPIRSFWSGRLPGAKTTPAAELLAHAGSSL